MRAILKYILMAAVVIMATACEKESLLSQYEGGVTFDVKMSTSSRTGSVENGEQPFVPEKVRVRIYRGDGSLIRRYTNMADIPSPLYLVAGNYSVTVDGGDLENVAFKNPASDEERKQKLCYAGSNTFTVEANKTSAPITVNCPTINSQVVVGFDKTDSETDNLNKRYENRYLSDVQIKVAAISVDGSVTTFDALSDEIEEAEAPNLLFTYENDDPKGGNQNGYFIMPSGVTTLTWAFKAQHETDGLVDLVGTLSTNVESGKAYKINFKYARTPNGAGGITVKIDESLDIRNDIYSFKPQPEITGDGFDVTIPNAYLGEDIELYCESIYKLEELSLNSAKFFVGGDVVEDNGVIGLACEKVNDTKVKITLSPDYFASFPSGAVSLNFNMQDNDGVEVLGPYPQTVTFMKQGFYNGREITADLWANTADLSAVVTDESVSFVGFKIRKKGTTEWSDVFAASEVPAEAGNGFRVFKASTVASWTESENSKGHKIYTPDVSKSIFAGNTYEIQTVIGDKEYGNFVEYTAPTSDQTIPYATFEDSSLSCFGTKNSSAPYWGSGNNSFVSTLCRQATYNGMVGEHCVKMAASYATVMLASGNLFTGTFSFSALAMSGTVSFGIPYNWQERPSSLRLKYYSKIKKVDNVSGVEGVDTYLGIDEWDEASIYVCIVDWSGKHEVKSGNIVPSGSWSPEDGGNNRAVSVGKIVGYGVVYPRGTTKGNSMIDLEIPIHYYDKVTKPNGNYTLVISAATSRYGDFSNGCESNEMYVDNFHWGYDVPTNLYDEINNQIFPEE